MITKESCESPVISVYFYVQTGLRDIQNMGAQHTEGLFNIF